ISDVRIGGQKLAVDVGAEAADDAVDIPENAGHIAVNVENAMRSGLVGQLDLGKVDGAGSRAAVHELGEGRSHFPADHLLRRAGRTADVQRQDDVEQLLQLARERLLVRLRLDEEYVDGRAGEVPSLERFGQSGNIDHASAACVEQIGALAHADQL